MILLIIIIIIIINDIIPSEGSGEDWAAAEQPDQEVPEYGKPVWCCDWRSLQRQHQARGEGEGKS